MQICWNSTKHLERATRTSVCCHSLLETKRQRTRRWAENNRAPHRCSYSIFIRSFEDKPKCTTRVGTHDIKWFNYGLKTTESPVLELECLWEPHWWFYSLCCAFMKIVDNDESIPRSGTLSHRNANVSTSALHVSGCLVSVWFVVMVTAGGNNIYNLSRWSCCWINVGLYYDVN